MKSLTLWVLRCYRVFVSPSLGQQCRYYPSCSAYAEQSIAEYGALRGSLVALARLLRCHPWARGGVDLAPRLQWKYPPDQDVGC